MPKDSLQTHGFKERMRIGKEIADQLPQFMSQADVGRRLGVSQQLVSRLEREALYKVAMRLKQAAIAL